jgi:hypothetical protein
MVLDEYDYILYNVAQLSGRGSLVILGDTIIPWLLGTLLLLALLTLVITFKTWRDMKRSPYFFLRRQAEKRMQSYSLASLGLLLAASVTSTYAWQTPSDTTPRVAILVNSKPPKEEIVALVQAASDAEANDVRLPELAESEVPSTVSADLELLAPVDLLIEVDPILPEAFDKFEPIAQLQGATAIGQILFSTEIGTNYEAINPRRIFAEGRYTLYATFDFADMSNGMEWSWVWRHNGSVVDGGNELWNYGENGLGFIYLNPTQGFSNGEYGLEVFVNGDMLSQSSATMNNAAVAAGN